MWVRLKVSTVALYSDAARRPMGDHAMLHGLCMRCVRRNKATEAEARGPRGLDRMWTTLDSRGPDRIVILE